MMGTITNPVEAASILCQEIKEMPVNQLEAGDCDLPFRDARLVGDQHGEIACGAIARVNSPEPGRRIRSSGRKGLSSMPSSL